MLVPVLRFRFVVPNAGAGYLGNYPRLVALENKYDPTNLFRLNANAIPSV